MTAKPNEAISLVIEQLFSDRNNNFRDIKQITSDRIRISNVERFMYVKINCLEL